MNFDLPPTGTEQPTAFFSAEGCTDWLADLPVNAGQAQALLLRQLNLMHRFTLPAITRFEILETLLPTLYTLQEEISKKFAGKPLPFSPPEQAALESTLATWQALSQGYTRCFEAYRHNDAAISEHAATVAQRTLATLADWQISLCRGEQLPVADYWQKLHEIFAVVERNNLSLEVVSDKVRHGNMMTRPLAAFAECHLLHSASPYELPAQQLTWISRWARRWSFKVEILTAPPEDIRNRAVPLWFDIDASKPAGYTPHPCKGGRWLETSEIRKSIALRLQLLGQGRAPSEMQLGDDVTQPAVGQLLARALTRWCKGGEPRRHDRTAVSGNCNFVAGFDAVAFHLSGGQTFTAATNDDATLRRQREEFELFGTIGKAQHAVSGKSAGADVAPMENWKIMDDWKLLDESVSGLRITRPLKEGGRVGAGLLIAVKTPGNPRLVLGSVRWALRDDEKNLSAGIQIFAGDPRPIGIRPGKDELPQSPRGAFKHGFLLYGGDLTNGLPSIILPVGTFRIGRELEMKIVEQQLAVKLTHVLDRGSDYERCAYSLLNAPAQPLELK